MPDKPNPARIDPTRTTMLRRRFMADMGKRFRAIRGAVNRLVIDEDAFGLSSASPMQLLIDNTRWQFLTDDRKLTAFRDWLQGQMDAGVLSVASGPEGAQWTDTYIDSAYKSGLVRAYTDANKMDALDPDIAAQFSGGRGELLQPIWELQTQQVLAFLLLT